MAQVYLDNYSVLLKSPERSYIDPNTGEAKIWSDKNDALNFAKVNYGNNTFRIMVELKVNSDDTFDESG